MRIINLPFIKRYAMPTHLKSDREEDREKYDEPNKLFRLSIFAVHPGQKNFSALPSISKSIQQIVIDYLNRMYRQNPKHLGSSNLENNRDILPIILSYLDTSPPNDRLENGSQQRNHKAEIELIDATHKEIVDLQSKLIETRYDFFQGSIFNAQHYTDAINQIEEIEKKLIYLHA